MMSKYQNEEKHFLSLLENLRMYFTTIPLFWSLEQLSRPLLFPICFLPYILPSLAHCDSPTSLNNSCLPFSLSPCLCNGVCGLWKQSAYLLVYTLQYYSVNSIKFARGTISLTWRSHIIVTTQHLRWTRNFLIPSKIG